MSLTRSAEVLLQIGSSMIVTELVPDPPLYQGRGNLVATQTVQQMDKPRVARIQKRETPVSRSRVAASEERFAFQSEIASRDGVDLFLPPPSAMIERAPLVKVAHPGTRIVRTEMGSLWTLPPAVVVHVANASQARKEATRFGLQRRPAILPDVEIWTAGSEDESKDILANRLKSLDGVDWLEQVFIEEFSARQGYNDPLLYSQWFHGNPDWPINIPGGIGSSGAWIKFRGKRETIAVIDEFFDLEHEELGAVPHHPQSSRFFLDTFSSDVSRVNDVKGRRSGASHGTQCASMALGRLNNNWGGAGVAPDATLMALSLGGSQMSQMQIAAALVHAANLGQERYDGAGASVITCSLGPNHGFWPLSEPLKLAIDMVTRGGDGVPLFWAVANDEVEIRLDGASSHPDVIAVGRSDRAGFANGSAYGPELAFLAPGVDVHLPKSRSKMGPVTGTSFAAPCAAGVAALMLQASPGLTGGQIKRILMETCDKTGDKPYDSASSGISRNHFYGAGRVNALAALAALGAL